MEKLKRILIVGFIVLMSGCSLFKEEIKNPEVEVNETTFNYIEMEEGEDWQLVWIGEGKTAYLYETLDAHDTSVYTLNVYDSNDKLIEETGPYDIMKVVPLKNGGFYTRILDEDRNIVFRLYGHNGDKLIEKTLGHTREVNRLRELMNGEIVFLYKEPNGYSFEAIDQEGNELWKIDAIPDTIEEFDFKMNQEEELLYYYFDEETNDYSMFIKDKDGTREILTEDYDSSPFSFDALFADEDSGYVYDYARQFTNYITKIDDQGEELWKTGPYETVRYFRQHEDGYSFMDYVGKLNFNMKLVYLDKEGNEQFSEGNYDFSRGTLARLDDGSFIILYEVENEDSKDQYFLKRIGLDGKEIWNIEQEGNYYSEVLHTNNNELVVEPRVRDFSITSYLIKYDEDGNERWKLGPYRQVYDQRYIPDTDEIIYVYKKDDHKYLAIIDSDGNEVYKEDYAGFNKSEIYPEYYAVNGGKIEVIKVYNDGTSQQEQRD